MVFGVSGARSRLHMGKNVFAMCCVMFGDTDCPYAAHIVEKILRAVFFAGFFFSFFASSFYLAMQILRDTTYSVCVFTFFFLSQSFSFFFCSISVKLRLLHRFCSLSFVPYLQLGFLYPYNDCVLCMLRSFLFMRVHISVILCDYIFHYIRAFFPFTWYISIFFLSFSFSFCLPPQLLASFAISIYI